VPDLPRYPSPISPVPGAGAESTHPINTLAQRATPESNIAHPVDVDDTLVISSDQLGAPLKSGGQAAPTAQLAPPSLTRFPTFVALHQIPCVR
jgi:hypothetical protein